VERRKDHHGYGLDWIMIEVIEKGFAKLFKVSEEQSGNAHLHCTTDDRG
jgi:hypothetical protein